MLYLRLVCHSPSRVSSKTETTGLRNVVLSGRKQGIGPDTSHRANDTTDYTMLWAIARPAPVRQHGLHPVCAWFVHVDCHDGERRLGRYARVLQRLQANFQCPSMMASLMSWRPRNSCWPSHSSNERTPRRDRCLGSSSLTREWHPRALKTTRCSVRALLPGCLVGRDSVFMLYLVRYIQHSQHTRWVSMRGKVPNIVVVCSSAGPRHGMPPGMASYSRSKDTGHAFHGLLTPYFPDALSRLVFSLS